MKGYRRIAVCGVVLIASCFTLEGSALASVMLGIVGAFNASDAVEKWKAPK